MKKQKKNRKSVVENLKLLQYSLIAKLQAVLFIILIGSSPIFATTKEENLSDEFFNAAMNLPTDESTAVPVQVAESSANSAQSGGSFMQPVIDVFNNLTDTLQNFGSSISIQIEKLIGHNPFLSKLLVVLILVFVCIIIIIFLAFIAKKIISKTNNLQVSNADCKEENYEEKNASINQSSKNISDTAGDLSIPEQEENTIINDNSLGLNLSKKLTSPLTVEDAVKIFLKITE